MTKIRFVLYHLDEKWFYAIKCRSDVKYIEHLGIGGKDTFIQHKGHIQKEMYVVISAFVLNDNDITKGGLAIPIACIRVGKMVPAQKDLYKRVYKPDGTYHYPCLAENILRKKGQLYFQPLELTGASEGTAKKPKISLLKINEDETIPALERKVVERFNKGGTVRVVIVKQEDGAGLYQCKEYTEAMEQHFNKRDWTLFNQPPNSPTTNTKDACIFPKMSNKVSNKQAINFGA